MEYYKLKPEIIFEGEFKNGKRHGKGLEYNRSGDVIFEGEYKDGKNGMELEINMIIENIMK